MNAGLQGENLGVDPALQQFGGDALPALHEQADIEHGGGDDESMGVTGWQEKAEFEREQEDVAGEIGSRVAAPLSHADMVEQRKREKKERRKQERREKNQT